MTEVACIFNCGVKIHLDFHRLITKGLMLIFFNNFRSIYAINLFTFLIKINSFLIKKLKCFNCI